MNEDILQGKWKQLKGEIKARWGKLTDDEVEEIAGRREKLSGILQERYGYTRQQALENVNQFLATIEKKLKGEPEEERVY